MSQTEDGRHYLELQKTWEAANADLAERFAAAEIGDLKGQVDRVKFKMDSWEAQADVLESWAIQLMKKATGLKKKVEGYEQFIQREMEVHKFEELPGEIFRVALRDSNPKTSIKTEATPMMHLKYPELVRLETNYTWDKKRLKELSDSDSVPADLDVRVTQGKHIRFYLKKDV